MAAEDFNERIERYKKMDAQNKRRSELGVRLNIWETESSSFSASDSRYSSARSSDCLGSEKLTRSDRWKLLRRAKNFLARRSVDAECFDSLTPLFRSKHPDWRGKNFPLLDYFSGLKYSYSAPLPVRVISRRRGDDVLSGHVSYFDLSFDAGGKSKKARVSDLVRSRSIRLDPVDSPKQMFLYRLRIQRCISWAYSLGFVPVMMTLTLFHRWHPLKGLLNVLSKAWNYFFTGTRMATRRAEKIGLVGYIRRAEETINNKSRRDESRRSYNSGWHPHYHVILFVPRDRLSVVSEMEDEFREAWFQAVSRYFELEFGEQIDSSYAESFRRHGLVFSRRFDCQVRPEDGSSSSVKGARPPLRHVDDSEYVAKIFGCEANTLYGGDTEMTSSGVKSSMIPFDLLCEDTAENNDLWVEYALATKGVKSFFFSRGLERRVFSYFEMYPDRDPVKPLSKKDDVVAQLSRDAYHFFYRTFKVDEMLKVTTKGYDALREWCLQVYKDSGIPEEDITEDMLPQLPGTCSWVSGERRRHLTNLVDVLPFNQSQAQTSVRGDEDEVVRGSDIQSIVRDKGAHVDVTRGDKSGHMPPQVDETQVAFSDAAGVCEEPGTVDNSCHGVEEADFSMESREKQLLWRLHRASLRPAYQQSLFETVGSVLKPVSAPVQKSRVDRASSPEPVESSVELDWVDYDPSISCFGVYLKIFEANCKSADGFREFLQTREFADLRALLMSLPLTLESLEPDKPEPPQSSLSTPGPVDVSPDVSEDFSDGGQGDGNDISATDVSLPSSARAATLSSGIFGGFDGLFVGDYLPDSGLKSPKMAVEDACSAIINSGQEVDWKLVKFIVDSLGNDSVSSMDLIESARQDIEALNEARILVNERKSDDSLSISVEQPSDDSSSSKNSYLDDELDMTFRARYEEVAKSVWYPEWYKDRMALLADASDKAVSAGLKEIDIDSTIIRSD